ncbi:BamA/TamA family outer membrane protein [Echinicola sp. 20G]|uniref:BamA/TamA family outer membrane protein n=1 Tax=Echinicola sp. 20G TaxID=2781961 RepID=UPI0019112378|nr:BamA/TamA family outer membrane protein [Echinicola sp. 20G]
MKKSLLILLLFGLVGSSFSQEITQRLYLIGDGGQLDGNSHPVSLMVEKMLKREPSGIKSDVIFLGDNIYPKGMPELGDKRETLSKAILDAQFAFSNQVEGEIWMIPGNHDWEKGHDGGWNAILRAQAYVDSLHLSNVFWVPQDGCPGPYVRELNEHTVLIAIDSQWWLQPVNRPGLDSDCEYKSEDELIASIGDVFEANQDKLVLLAMHHPMETFGEHNGAFSWRDHLFPFTAINPDLYIPLPVIGSIYPMYRTYLGNIQDVPHPKYQQLIKSMEAIMEGHPNVVVLSGHEHALEYTITPEARHVVSGAGSKSTLIKKKNPAEFTYEQQGLATLDFYSNGEVKLDFYSLEDGFDPIYSDVVYTKSSGQQQEVIQAKLPFRDSVKAAVSQQYFAGPEEEKFYGKNYRNEWGQPIWFRTFDLKKERGGMEIVKRGGGMQTRSLRLADSTGREYVLRSVDKFPEAAIPAVLRNTVAKDIVQDQISASHPYGALIIPKLADAAKVFHTNPELVWLPDDTELGIYQKNFGNAVYLYEEREITPEKLEDEEYKFYSTDKMLRKRFGDQDYELDQKKILRARLLDLYIGDWDRHDDQWRWIGIEDKKGREFVPVPRDRDQAFFVNEGVLPKIFSRKWIMPKFQGFGYEMRDVNGFMFNGRYFDRSFLNDLDKEDWEEEADKFLERMDDEVIEVAVHSLPDEIYAHRGIEITDKLKYRRSWMKEEALKYYEFISKAVDVYGTQKSELFEIRHEDDGKVDVEVSKISKKGNVKQKIYNRKFDPNETNEIRIYGLGGEDLFEITGSGPGKIKVRVLGGFDTNVIQDKSDLDHKANLVYHWNKQQDTLLLGESSKLISSKKPSVYEYNRKAFKYDMLFPLVSLEYNVDDGIFLGGGVQWTTQGFRKEPFAMQQSIKANIAIKTLAVNLYYQGRAVDVLQDLDVEWDATIKAPNYVNNFFGYGNERAEFDKDKYGYKYYRVRYNQINLNTWLRKDLTKNVLFRVGPLLQRTRMDEDDNFGKYIYSPDQTDVDVEDLENAKLYAGLDAQLVVDDTDHPKMPNRGVKFVQQFSHLQGINEYSGDLTQMNTALTLYWSRQIPSIITWATQFGGGVNWGDYEFFQAQTLGGMDNLRGYRRSRFAGDAMIYNNTEARIRLSDFTTYLFPATVGVTVFHDIGRVWYKDENSSKWHNSFGAGVWLAPLNLMVLSGTVAISKEGVLPTFTFGYQF